MHKLIHSRSVNYKTSGYETGNCCYCSHHHHLYYHTNDDITATITQQAVRLSWLENASSRPLYSAADFDP